MSIASELTALAANKAAIKAAIEAKNPTVAPTGELAQWPTSIASIGAVFDAEVEYLTVPAGAYVLPGVVDKGGFYRYDFEVSMRLPSDFDPSTTLFRMGVWRGATTTSTMMWPYVAEGRMRICSGWNTNGPYLGGFKGSVFRKIGTDGTYVTYEGAHYMQAGDITNTIETDGYFVIGGLHDLTAPGIVTNETDFDIEYISFSSPLGQRMLVPVRRGGVGYLYDAALNRLFGSETSVALVPGPDKS